MKKSLILLFCLLMFLTCIAQVGHSERISTTILQCEITTYTETCTSVAVVDDRIWSIIVDDVTTRDGISTTSLEVYTAKHNFLYLRKCPEDVFYYLYDRQGRGIGLLDGGNFYSLHGDPLYIVTDTRFFEKLK